MPDAAVVLASPFVPAPALKSVGKKKGTGSSWPRFRLWGPLLVLLVEVAALTPVVEFSGGPMAYVANARVCSGLLFAAVVFLFLASKKFSRFEVGASWWGRGALWLAANLGLFGLLFGATLHQANSHPGSVGWIVAAGWTLLALGVGLTAVLAFFPFRPVLAWVKKCRVQMGTALGLGMALILLAPWAQGFWANLHRPAVTLNRWLLQCTYQDSLAEISREGWPVLGTRRLLLLVTPQCSELEAIAAFWLLAAAVVATRWRELRKGRVAFFLVLGTGLLYVLIALRIFGLLVLGMHVSPKVCVAVAHSRIGSILLVGIAAGLLALGGRWCRRAAGACPG